VRLHSPAEPILRLNRTIGESGHHARPATAQAAMPVIGWLSPASPDSDAAFRAALLDGLKGGGFIDAETSGSNISGRKHDR
jgi:hypothetical protein